MPTLTADQAKASCCGPDESATKMRVITFPILTPQGQCCSDAEAASKAFPKAPSQGATTRSEGLETVTFRIEGTSCSCEAQMVEKRVKSLKGVKTFSLNAITNRMKLTYDRSALSLQDIQTAVKKAGGNAILITSK